VVSVCVPFQQRQYIFIHDTLLEHIRAGDTEVDARDLYSHFQSMKKKAGMRNTLLELEYEVRVM